MKMLDDINLFRFIVDSGSVLAASEKLNIPHKTLSRRIQILEDTINVRLFHRSPRKLILTDAGKKLYSTCSPLINKLTYHTEYIVNETKSSQGTLKICCPQILINFGFHEYLSKFLSLEPHINLLVEATTDVDSVNILEWDAVIMEGPLRSSSNIARKIGAFSYILVASSEYLQDKPQINTPLDLEGHDLLKSKSFLNWDLSSKNQEQYKVKNEPRLLMSELTGVKSSCLDGLGIALLPSWAVKLEVKNGHLEQILPHWSCETKELFLIYGHREHQPQKLVQFIDFIKSCALFKA